MIVNQLQTAFGQGLAILVVV